MENLVGPTVHYCCIWNGKKKLHSQNNGDHELEKLADLCLENKPSFHLWYFRTVKERVYGFLTEEGVTYFAIANSSVSNPSFLSFLQCLRDGYKRTSRNDFGEELVPVVQRLIASLEGLSRQNAVDHITEIHAGESITSTKMPLLGRSASSDGRRMGTQTRKLDGDDNEESHSRRRIELDIPPDAVGGFSLQKNLSSNCMRNQPVGQRLWIRQVKIVVAIDMLVCMVLLAIWLAICKGLTCVS